MNKISVILLIALSFSICMTGYYFNQCQKIKLGLAMNHGFTPMNLIKTKAECIAEYKYGDKSSLNVNEFPSAEIGWEMKITGNERAIASLLDISKEDRAAFVKCNNNPFDTMFVYGCDVSNTEILLYMRKRL